MKPPASLRHSLASPAGEPVHSLRKSTATWDEAPTVKKGRRRHSPLHTGGARRGSHHKICGESTRDLVDAILEMRVDPGQQLVAGQLAGASTGAPATAATAAETHPKCGPAGESTWPRGLSPAAGRHAAGRPAGAAGAPRCGRSNGRSNGRPQQATASLAPPPAARSAQAGCGVTAASCSGGSLTARFPGTR